MALNKKGILSLYKKRARNYDISANLYYLIGFRETKYRKIAVSSLELETGNTVVEIGCGTGLNFQYLVEKVGNEGKVFGVDLTPEMLECANKRVEKNKWNNITLINTDAGQYDFPKDVNAVISTFALTLIPEYEKIIECIFEVLPNGGKFVVLDIKRPEVWPLWLTKIGVMVMSPFGVSLDLSDRKPWIVMKKYARDVSLLETYWGAVYIATATK